MAVAPIAPTDQQGRTQMVFTAGSAGLRIIKARVGEMMLSSSVAVIYTGPTVEVEAPKGEEVPTEQPTDEPADEPVEEPVKEPVEPSRPVTVRPAQFKISLKTGLNMISLPVQPDQPVSAKTLARDLAATVILRLDADSQKFIPFVLEHFEETNFEIQGGMGIIVNVKEAKEHTFSGQAWDNVPAAGIDSNDRQPVWAFSLLFGGAGLEVDWRQNQLTVTNLSRGSRYGIQLDHNRPVGVATVVDSTQQAVIQVGDLIQVRLDQQRWRYRVSDRDLANAFAYLSLEADRRVPAQTYLRQNYPNPFNPETWIPFELSQDTEVTVAIYDVQGRQLRQLQLGMLMAGKYLTADQAAYWDDKTESGESVASGTYFYRIDAGDYRATRKMVILK